MNRALEYINLAGVVLLAGTCGIQWKINRQLNLEINHLEKIRIEHVEKIKEHEKTIAGCTADLDAFRLQLQTAGAALKETDAKTLLAQRENVQLTAERDQLKENVLKWSDAVNARDEQLRQTRDQITTLANDRNAAVGKFNELAQKYNTVVQDLNNRTKEFNGLVEKYNALAKEASK